MLELDHVYTIEWPLVFRIKTGLEAQGFTGKMSSRDTCDMTTKQWSTATLNDGVAHVQKIAKQELEESESDLERQLEDCYLCRKKQILNLGIYIPIAIYNLGLQTVPSLRSFNAK